MHKKLLSTFSSAAHARFTGKNLFEKKNSKRFPCQCFIGNSKQTKGWRIEQCSN